MNLIKKLSELKNILYKNDVFSFDKIDYEPSNEINFMEMEIIIFTKWYNNKFLNDIDNKNEYTDNIIELINKLTLFFESDNSNLHSYIHSLDNKEKIVLKLPKYPKIVWLNKGKSKTFFKLSKNGVVLDSFISEEIPNLAILRKNPFNNLNIKETYINLCNRNFKFIKNDEIKRTIINYDKKIYLRQEFLKVIFYNILIRNVNDKGIENSIKFAYEFNMNIHDLLNNNYISNYKDIDKIKILK